MSVILFRFLALGKMCINWVYEGMRLGWGERGGRFDVLR